MSAYTKRKVYIQQNLKSKQKIPKGQTDLFNVENKDTRIVKIMRNKCIMELSIKGYILFRQTQ